MVVGESLPKSLQERGVVANVLLAKDGLNGAGGLFGVVEGNAAAKAVSFYSAHILASELTGRDGAQRGTQ